VLLLEIPSKIPLELLGFGTCGEPAALQGVNDFGDFLSADAGFVKRNLHQQKIESRK
jgi:hypothetical protein